MNISNVDYYQRASFEKDTRFYVISLENDLFNDFVIRRHFGRKGAPTGRTLVEVFLDKHAANERFLHLCSYRGQKRHYQRVQN